MNIKRKPEEVIKALEFERSQIIRGIIENNRVRELDLINAFLYDEYEPLTIDEMAKEIKEKALANGWSIKKGNRIRHKIEMFYEDMTSLLHNYDKEQDKKSDSNIQSDEPWNELPNITVPLIWALIRLLDLCSFMGIRIEDHISELWEKDWSEYK